MRGNVCKNTVLPNAIAFGFLFRLAASCVQTVQADQVTENVSPRGTVSGTIVDAKQNPIVGASVLLYRYELGNWRWGYMEEKGTPIASDERGIFRFSDLENGEYWVAVTHVDFARSICRTRLNQTAKVVAKPAISVVIAVKDQSGNPVVGARVRELSLRGANGQFRLHQKLLDRLDFAFPLSDDAGRIRLLLPLGDVLSNIVVDHPRFAAAGVDELTVSRGAEAEVTLPPGVRLTFRAVAKDPSDQVSSAEIELRHKIFASPATIKGCPVTFDDHGVARLTVESGDYDVLQLDHNDFCLTPYGESLSAGRPFRIEPGRNDQFRFDVRRKVPIRGRVVDSRTGRPIAGVFVAGELANSPSADSTAAENRHWTTVVFPPHGKTNDNGEYTMELSQGVARVTLIADNVVAESEHIEFTVSSDGSTVVPDIKTGPVPKVIGNVITADGHPAPNMVVCIRSKVFDSSPVLTDETGQFEIQPRYVPIDPETGRRINTADIIAFDPYRPVGAIAKVRIDKPEKTVLKLGPQDVNWPMSEFHDRMTDWERGVIPADRAKSDAAISLHGSIPPDLDGAHWLNTDGKAIRLTDLRGKYVLLDFWFTACLPCRLDHPSVKLVHELYKDRGVVVVGIHNKLYESLDTVRDYVLEQEMRFPVVVDFPDGRLVDRYQKHGIATAFPNYVLLGPDGKVLLDDRTIYHAGLAAFKLEIIRALLMRNSP